MNDSQNKHSIQTKEKNISLSTLKLVEYLQTKTCFLTYIRKKQIGFFHIRKIQVTIFRRSASLSSFFSRPGCASILAKFLINWMYTLEHCEGSLFAACFNRSFQRLTKHTVGGMIKRKKQQSRYSKHCCCLPPFKKKNKHKNLFERNQSLAFSKKNKNYKITRQTCCWNQRPRVPEPMVTLPHHPEIAPGSLPKISLNLWRRDHRPQDAWIARYKAPGASAVRETVSTTVGWHSRDSTHGIYGVLGWFLGIIKPINTQYIGLI